ncbi:carboxypeptidase-like regulatory domain-containing protein, partial [Planctomycetota bacterium]
DTTLGMLAEQEDKLQQEEFKERVRIVRIIESAGRFTKAAAVAGIIIAVLIGIIFFSKLTEGPKPAVIGQTETDRQGPVTEPAEQTKPTPEATVEAQLEQIRQMVEAGDTAGLIELLQNGPLESKIAATYYLGSIGDIETLSALEQISKQQGPGDPNNLFITAALEKIESRLGIKEPAPQPGPSIKIARQKDDFSPSGILSGIILDAATGEAISKAEVRASKGRIYMETTDVNGFYHFEEIEEAGNYRVGVWSDAHIGIYDYDKMPVVNLSSETQTVKHFELEPACMIEVRVVNEKAEPVEDVDLIATSLADEHGREIGDRLYSKKTDANGIMLLGGFEPSDTSYMITALHRKETIIEEGQEKRWRARSDYAPGKLLVTLNEPGVIDYGEIVLEKGVAVKGYAEYADGVPVEGLEIGAKPVWWHSSRSAPTFTVDPNGYFALEHIMPGTYSIDIHIPLGAGMTSVPTVMQTRLPIEDELLIVKLPQKSPGSLVSISGTIKIEGLLRAVRNVNIHIEAYSREHGHRSTNLRRDTSSFTIDRLEPGNYRLTFFGSNIERRILENVKAPSEGLEVELKYFAKPRLWGTVVRADTSEPVKQFRVRARKLKALRGSYYSQHDRWTEFRGTNGQFDIEAVGPGVYQVQTDAEGFAPVWSDEINTDVNEPVLIELSAGGSIKGQVVDEAGELVSGAKVMPLSKASGTTPRAEDTFVSENGAAETINGEFILEHLPAG